MNIMTKIMLSAGVGVVALLMISSTCSSDSQASMKNSPVEMSAEKSKAGSGIKFSSISLEKAKKEAKETGKLIFVDCYTSWCGPCKQMAATTFKDEEVGEFFNEHFINIKVDIEKDADGPEMARLYKIRAYPTLLILDGDGNLVDQTIGLQRVNQLMAFANGAL